MSEDQDRSKPLSDFEQALAALTPSASRIDRDRLMIRLGEQAARARPTAARGAFVWQCATAASLVVALGLGARLATLPATGAADATVVAERGVGPPERAAPAIAAIAPDAAATRVAPGAAALAPWAGFASGKLDPNGTLSMRPAWRLAEIARYDLPAEERAAAPRALNRPRPETMRWRDRALWRDEAESSSPRPTL